MTDSNAFELSVRDRKRLAAELADVGSGPLAIRTHHGDLELPIAARRAVEQLLTVLAAGHCVHVLVDERDLTTQQAADLLGLSRTFVVRLIDDGKLAAHFAGSHRRVRTADVLAYARRRHARLEAAERITTADVAVGIPYR